MSLEVREMQLGEVGVVIDYFHSSTPEHLDLLGVDPTRLPSRSQWKQLYEQDFLQPIEKRRTLLVLWQLNGNPLGFSTVDKIAYGKQAYMHLHVLDPNNRKSGHGQDCVRKSVDIYFARLKLEQLFCEPNAFQRRAQPNTSNRRLQVRQNIQDRARPIEFPSSGHSVGSGQANERRPATMTPNPSIERTSQGLRPCAASHVKR